MKITLINTLAISCCFRKMANEISFMDMEEWACYSPAESGKPLMARLFIQMSAEAIADGQLSSASTDPPT